MQEQDHEICGAPTTNGGECTNKAESCPWHDEDGNRTGKQPGRKGKYTEERVSRIVEAAREGLPMKSCARAGNIDESTFYDWMENKPEFSKKVKHARSEAERELAKLAREKDPRYILSRSYKWEKPTEKKEHKHDGGESVKFEMRYTDKDEEEKTDEQD